jgi:fatty acid desaturase
MDIASIRRDELVAPDGSPYRAFRAGLTPRFGRLYLEIFAGHAAIAASAAAVVVVAHRLPAATVPAVLLGAALIGYWVHYLHPYLHEGAHFNLARSRARNDLLSNLLLGVLTGHDVRNYRRVHFEHHRRLGTPEDTERSYFDALDLRFFVEALTGVRLLRAMLTWSGRGAPSEAKGRGAYFRVVTLASAVLNGAIVLGSLATGNASLGVAWCLGIFVFLPLVMSVRQVLEHRSLEADPAVDYEQVPHGPVNRLFGSGPLASTLGSAGFNRHLLHHWDPQLSCTRLAELEAFLLETNAAEVIRSHQTSYIETFRAIVAASRRTA